MSGQGESNPPIARSPSVYVNHYTMPRNHFLKTKAITIFMLSLLSAFTQDKISIYF